MGSLLESLNEISNMLVSILSGSAPPSVWNSLPASLRNVPTLFESKSSAQDLPVLTGLPINLGVPFLQVYSS